MRYRSPASDRSENDSPCQQTDLVSSTLAQNADELPANDMPFNLSDVDMNEGMSNTNDSPFEIDLSALFTDNTYDAAPTELSDLGIFVNEFDAGKVNSGYDACESSAESTTSRDGMVSVDMEKIRAKKSKQTVQANLPNFTPLVLTGTFSFLQTCWKLNLCFIAMIHYLLKACVLTTC